MQEEVFRYRCDCIYSVYGVNIVITLITRWLIFRMGGSVFVTCRLVEGENVSWVGI